MSPTRYRRTAGASPSGAYVTWWQDTTAGEWRSTHRTIADATRTISSGVMFAVPYLLPPGTIDRLAIEVTTAGAAGSVAKLGVAADNGVSRPGALLDTAGTVSLEAIGVQELATSAIVEHDGGLIWFYVVGQSISGAPVVRGVNATDTLGIFSSPTAAAVLSGTLPGGYYQNGVTGALPDPMVITSSTASVPRVAFRFSPS